MLDNFWVFFAFVNCLDVARGKLVLVVGRHNFEKTFRCEEQESKSMAFKRENILDLPNKAMLNSIFFPRKGEYFESVVIFKDDKVGNGSKLKKREFYDLLLVWEFYLFDIFVNGSYFDCFACSVGKKESTGTEVGDSFKGEADSVLSH